MANPSRPYLVTNALTGIQRLIQAPNQAQARNFVARNQYRVELVSATDVIGLLSAGMKAETATEEVAAAPVSSPLPGGTAVASIATEPVAQDLYLAGITRGVVVDATIEGQVLDLVGGVVTATALEGHE